MKCPYCGEEMRSGVVYTSPNGVIWMPENVKIKWFWSRGDLLKNGGIAVVPAMIETARELTEAVKSGKIVEYQMQEYKGVSPEVETGSTTYNVLGHFQVVLRDDGGKERRMDVCRFYLMERVNNTGTGRTWVDKLEGDEQIYIRAGVR